MLWTTVGENMHLEISWGCQPLLRVFSVVHRNDTRTNNRIERFDRASLCSILFVLFIDRRVRRKKRKLPESIKRTNSSVSPMMTQRNRKSKNRLELQIYSLTNSISTNWKSGCSFSSSDCWEISVRMKVRKEKNRLNKCIQSAIVSVSSAIRCVCRFSCCPRRRLSDHLQ